MNHQAGSNETGAPPHDSRSQLAGPRGEEEDRADEADPHEEEQRMRPKAGGEKRYLRHARRRAR